MGIIRKEDVHSSFDDYIKEVVDYDSTITSLNDLTNNGFNGISKALTDLTDMNSFTTSGVYDGVITLNSSILNLPLYATSSGPQRLKIEVTYEESSKIVITQKIMYQDGLFNNRVFLRTRMTSTIWKPWIELLNSSRVVNNLTTTDTSTVLSGAQGKVINNTLATKAKIITSVVNLTETSGTIGITVSDLPSGNPCIVQNSDFLANPCIVNGTVVTVGYVKVYYTNANVGSCRFTIVYKA